jgi:hypothetical protein
MGMLMASSSFIARLSGSVVIASAFGSSTPSRKSFVATHQATATRNTSAGTSATTASPAGREAEASKDSRTQTAAPNLGHER